MFEFRFGRDKTPLRISNANAIASGTPEAGSAETKAAPPETLVAELYKQHDAKKSPFFQTKDRGLVDKYFTKPLGRPDLERCD